MKHLNSVGTGFIKLIAGNKLVAQDGSSSGETTPYFTRSVENPVCGVKCLDNPPLMPVLTESRVHSSGTLLYLCFNPPLNFTEISIRVPGRAHNCALIFHDAVSLNENVSPNCVLSSNQVLIPLSPSGTLSVIQPYNVVLNHDVLYGNPNQCGYSRAMNGPLITRPLKPLLPIRPVVETVESYTSITIDTEIYQVPFYPINACNTSGYTINASLATG